MKLEDIGFYTLSEDRARESSIISPLWRCELILTDACNFKCPYCRGLRDDLRGSISYGNADRVISYWIEDGLKNVRFSGGEPTLWKGLDSLVRKCRDNGVEHIAVSTNGSASLGLYQNLIDVGVNDFSISLDGGCCAIGDAMTGGISGSWDKVVETIKFISSQTYLSVGMVFTERNIEQACEVVLFADSLGVSDIRVIPSAQYNRALRSLSFLSDEILSRHPILRYRINHIREGISIRGLRDTDTSKCRLVLDDMAVAGGKHFPCIIYLREGGDAIGSIGSDMRVERERWMNGHFPKDDPICRKNCLDVCRQYNNSADRYYNLSGTI